MQDINTTPKARIHSLSFGHFLIMSFVSKVCWIRFSSWERFIGFHIWGCPISTSLACLVNYRFSLNLMENVVLDGEWWRLRNHLVPHTRVYYIAWRVNLTKFSRNFVWALRTTATNCRVSFIYSYFVFPTKFRIVFLLHSNTVILLGKYDCGTVLTRL